MENRALEEVKHKLNKLDSYPYNDETFYDVAEEQLDQRGTSLNRMVEIYQHLQQEVSQKMSEMNQHMGMTPNCQLGCAFCCYFPIVVSRLEANMIIASIEVMPTERRESIKDHLRSYYKNYESLIDEATSLNFEEDIKFEYMKKQLPCPLLNPETNACMAYEARPLPCRTYVNYMDPQICADNYVPEETVSFEFIYEDYMSALNAAAQVMDEEESPRFLDYPSDLYRYDYLPVFLKEWIERR
ncbi:YkgJ family cysteine cluster protein [Aquisalibacillus elongatus]|uniref:Fe-S-cluster containining protein n=1 Tax=Aquisalibacillus elongatus TaxID=485577 RepID=A0A3N5C302_9BACI|nr:YkgJ family cysteine cluster protein [Aquisalibacillus elongatus]RPF50581.1 Fe-S-cluster containining protein [Aquisalibacillus elongatus]